MHDSKKEIHLNCPDFTFFAEFVRNVFKEVPEVPASIRKEFPTVTIKHTGRE